VSRLENEDVLDRMAERLKARPQILDRRREVVEHPFGMKQWMYQGAFLMRGLENVRAEFSLPRSSTTCAAPSTSWERVYSLHAPEVECIGKGKAHRPYEFGVKVSLATTLHRSAGGQFIAHAKALPGNPYDGHTLATVIPEIETQIGASLARIVADRGYRGHNAPPGHNTRCRSHFSRRLCSPLLTLKLRT
jgi:hypothetical protein